MMNKEREYVADNFKYMKILLPEGKYIKKIDINENDLEIEFSERKKVALLFISINDRYWPYLTQVIKDCKKNFLPQHKVDYFVWTDYNEKSKEKLLAGLGEFLKKYIEAESKQESLNAFLGVFAQIIKLYEIFYPAQVQGSLQNLASKGLVLKREANQFWLESSVPPTEEHIKLIYEEVRKILECALVDVGETLREVILSETEPIEWPHPTLMRYHLFLQQEEKLKDYDYIFYMDADMRVVAKISDEIMGEGLTAAEHPMYALRKHYIPPYEPNPNSSAYIKRPGKVVNENGVPRFKPYYYAGGFLGGKTKPFLEAMRVMKKNIDKDFDNNYIAVWNDESHWNKYLSENEPGIVLSPSYIYPDSLIKEYYEPAWGCSYEPKIITLTKPFTLSMQGAEEINKVIKGI